MGKFSGRMGLLVVLLSAVGCTTQPPLVSHAHVGHALTTWHDTPGQQGLMTVAAGDLQTAEREAQLACQNDGSYAGMTHARNVVNALVPEAAPDGSGSGYGAIRALIGTIEHLEYAAVSSDASVNLIGAIAELSVHGESVHERLKVAVDIAQELRGDTGAWQQHCRRLTDELRAAIHGGEIGPAGRGFRSVGFNALHANLLAALQRESDPAYAPVPRRYVLGLVRLPSGEWRYRLPKNNTQTYGDFGGFGGPSGYGY